MLVTFQGFTLEEGDGFDLPDFAGVLAAKSSETVEHQFNDHFRIFLFESNSDPDFHTGLLVTTKDQRSFCELRNENGKYKIKVSELEKGSQLMDFNFFILNKKTFAGMYQHYFQSCSTLQFCTFLRSKFWKPESEERQNKFRNYLMHGGMRPEKAEAEAKREFRRHLKFDLLYRPDGFKKILEGMAEIKSFEFPISTKTPKHDAFMPQNIELKKETRNFIFANKPLVKKIAASISKFANDIGLKEGKAIAVDFHGVDRAVSLLENVDNFGEFDFDEVTAEIELDLEKFAESWVTIRLLEAARKNRAIFCEP